MRSGAKGLGILTFVLDGSKGFAAVLVAEGLARGRAAESGQHLAVTAAFFVVIGHVFPVWLKWKGGKGVATAFGAFLALCPWAALSALGIWIVLVALTRFVSLASIVAAVLLPFLTVWLSPARFGIATTLGGVCQLLAGCRETPAEFCAPPERHGAWLWRLAEERSMSKVAIVGSGSWGTALALSLARRGDHSLRLWCHSPAICASIQKQRENTTYLPGFAIPERIHATPDLATALSQADIVISVVPSQHVRDTYQRLAPFLRPHQLLLSATKGIEDQTLLRMSQVIEQVTGKACGSLSGPSFAQEVAAGAPTAITVAFADSHIAGHLQEELSSPGLRLYTNDDVIGVELGGALKNVIAIAAGIASGLGLGHNSAAAIITRGIAEITRLAVALRWAKSHPCRSLRCGRSGADLHRAALA